MSYTCLLYHVVFATKDRRPWLSSEHLPRVQEYVGGIVRNLNGKLLAAGGATDHVHLAISLNSSVALADAVRTVKCNSTGWIHDTFPDLVSFAWQDGYAAFTVSKSALSQVQRYLAGQAAHHAERSFADELRALLAKHGIEFDESRLM
ncbi:MAG: IS200/IS605 family transposase [Planctomycetes bacterium]|nr:IS200/IS605 family transposase [Planctomycetota bacterium]